MAQSVVDALALIFIQSAKTDRVIERFLKSQRKWGSRDRKFFAESIFEIVRTARWLAHGAGIDKTPQAWTTQDFWSLWGARVLSQGIALPQWPELQNLRWTAPAESVVRAIKHSLSDELDEIGFSECGSDWESLITSLNHPAEVYLRTNLIATRPSDLQRKLLAEGVATEVVDPEKPALRLLVRKNLTSTSCFKDGLFEIQDLASQEVAPQVNPQAGETIIDACAGGGGKSLHMATLMGHRGRLIAMDISDRKLLALRERARRNKINIIETCRLEPLGEETKTSPVEGLYEQADRVLLDVPCSGSGVLRRNPDAKWRINRKILHEVQQTQARLLTEYSKMVKPGGLLVYSTCSIFPSENQNQIRQFLEKPTLSKDKSRQTSWELISEQSCDPRLKDWDGFYVAVMRRRSGAT